jgi:predicted SnoaL-like aldol condensation-catalyzing enzyme
MSPKALVLAATDALFRDHDVSAVDRYFAEPYLQHDPHAPNGLDFLRHLAANPALRYERVRAIAAGDLVVTHGRLTGFGPVPMVVFDIFRVEDGRIVEHWDAMQPEVATTRSGRTQLDGSPDVTDLDRTEENRRLVEGLFADVLYGHRMDRVPAYFSTTTYHQHNPGVADGLEGFGKAMAELAAAGLSMEYRRTFRTVAEGNLVFTHSEGIFAGRHVVFADLFRVADGRIVEHWDVIQDVPATTKSGLPMW